jgi:hypothetical protein
MVVLPVETLVARPLLLIAEAAGFEDVQTTEAETSCVLLSLKVPLAVNCLVVPTAMLEFAGATEIEIKLAPVTVRDAVAFTEPDAAVMDAVPVPTPVANPVLSIEAIDVDEDDQVTEGNS